VSRGSQGWSCKSNLGSRSAVWGRRERKVKMMNLIKKSEVYLAFGRLLCVVVGLISKMLRGQSLEDFSTHSAPGALIEDYLRNTHRDG
jgi:hypothetical protein